MMLVKLMIKNFYETHGNFDGIEDTSISQEIKRLSAEKNLTIKQYCYEVLGYTPVIIQDKLRDSEEVCAIRCHLVKIADDVQKVKKIYEDLKIPYVNLKSEKNVLKDQFEVYATMLYNYYRTTKDIMVVNSDGVRTFGVYLALLRQMKGTNKPSAEAVVVEQAKNLVKFKCVGKCTPSIYDKVFYVPNRISKEDQYAIQVRAISIAISASMGLAKPLVLSPTELAMLSFKNDKKYTYLLDVANSRGITYAQLLSEEGIFIRDQFPVYDSLGVFVIVAGDSVMYVTKESKDTIYTDTVNSFNSMANDLIKKLASNVERMNAF